METRKVKVGNNESVQYNWYKHVPIHLHSVLRHPEIVGEPSHVVLERRRATSTVGGVGAGPARGAAAFEPTTGHVEHL